MITIKFIRDGKCIMHLTERTVRNIDFGTAKIKDTLRQLTKTLVLSIRVDNSNLDELCSEEKPLPREIDSVRDLMVFAIAPFDSDCAYAEAEIEMSEGSTGGVSKYEFKNLFATSYEEHFAKDERDTIIKISLREWEA